MRARMHGRPRDVARRKLAPLVPEEGMRVQSPPLMLLRAVPCIDEDAEWRLAVAREELQLLSVVPALEAQRSSSRISLHRRSALTRRAPREQVLRELGRRRSCAGPAPRMSEELWAAVVLGHRHHTGGQPELVVRGESHQILLLTLEPAGALRDVPRVHTAEELRVDVAGEARVRRRALAAPPRDSRRAPVGSRTRRRRCTARGRLCLQNAGCRGGRRSRMRFRLDAQSTLARPLAEV